ncbi:MAG: hypothetical protein KDD52_02475 [Bdellovibrionales bacterium]|nr:hypothetical protein [Bdellovibrionales bacterium]
MSGRDLEKFKPNLDPKNRVDDDPQEEAITNLHKGIYGFFFCDYDFVICFNHAPYKSKAYAMT